MSEKTNVNFGTIFKRSCCLNSVSNNKMDASRILEKFNEKIKSGKDDPSINNSLIELVESLSDSTNASKYFSQPLYFIQELNKINKNTSNLLVDQYSKSILPYVENLSAVGEVLIERYNLDDDQRNKILESANRFKVADRILKNHNTISKRFNIESEILKTDSIGLKSVVELCCNMIDTYDVRPYQKLNLCVEEMSFLLEKNGIIYDKNKFVKYIVEYFLLRSDILSDRDLNSYRKALSESYYLTENDLQDVSYFFTDGKVDITYDKERDMTITVNKPNYRIREQIESFLMEKEKNINKFDSTIYRALQCSTLDLTMNIDSLLWLIWDVFKSDIFDQQEVFERFEKWKGYFISKISSNVSSLKDNLCYTIYKDDIIKLINKIKSVDNLIIHRISDSTEYIVKCRRYKSFLKSILEDLDILESLIYPENNTRALEFLESAESPILPLKEFKIFKFHNLVRAASNLDKYLKAKSKVIYNKGNKKIRKVVAKVKDILFAESNMYQYFGTDGKLDICVAEYYIDEDIVKEMSCLFDEICSEFNNSLINDQNETTKAYYIIHPGCLLEVHLKDISLLEEFDPELVITTESNELDTYINQLSYTESCMDSIYDVLDGKTVEDVINSFTIVPDITLDNFKVALEALSLLDVSKETIELFSEKFKNYRYQTLTESAYNSEQLYVDFRSENWEVEDNVPIDIQVEAAQILCAVLEAPDIKKPKVEKPKVGVDSKKTEKSVPDKKDSEKESKNPFKGLNLNSMQLYLEGLKSKMKDMSQKEKELSRNLDNNFRRLAKGMKDALISDRREAIIKGSVIPSFSKCIKIAIGLAGAGFITGNPLVPLLMAVGGFAASKKLTQKERLLLLDEIETELEVVEKEIQIADSKNQIKKYRTLLKYKKDLQRQYQRIRYNVRVGKDLLPDSTVGLKNLD